MSATDGEIRNILALPENYWLQDRYRVGEVLGAGGFGITYKAYDKYNQIYCAIKEYVPLGICAREKDQIHLKPSDNEKIEYYQHGKKRFQEEAATLKTVAGIPNIIRITDYFDANGTSYYVMDYLDGRNVSKIMKGMPDKKLPYDMAVRILYVIGNALDRVHKERRFLHRDISPDNIYVTKTGEIVLLDFGTAKHLANGNKQAGFSVVLKPGFAPPEQYRTDTPQGFYTDVYALASSFYYMASGKRMPDSMERLAGTEYIRIDQLVPQMSRQLAIVMDKALQLSYTGRYQTVGEFLGAFDEVRKGGQEEAEKKPSEKRQSNRSKQKKIPFLAWVENGNMQKIWYLRPGTAYSLGSREGKSKIVISQYQELGDIHCILQYEEDSGNFLIMDVSRRGTKVKDVILKKNRFYRVSAGQSCMLGDVCEVALGVTLE